MTCYVCGCNAPALQTRVLNGKSMPVCPFDILRLEDPATRTPLLALLDLRRPKDGR